MARKRENFNNSPVFVCYLFYARKFQNKSPTPQKTFIGKVLKGDFFINCLSPNGAKEFAQIGTGSK